MNKNKKISHSKQETISIRDRSFITTWGAGILEGGGVQFSKRLDFGASILKIHKMRRGSKY